jgi:hypothetical protein
VRYQPSAMARAVVSGWFQYPLNIIGERTISSPTVPSGTSLSSHWRMATHVHGFGEALMESLGIAQHRDDLQLASPR